MLSSEAFLWRWGIKSDRPRFNNRHAKAWARCRGTGGARLRYRLGRASPRHASLSRRTQTAFRLLASIVKTRMSKLRDRPCGWARFTSFSLTTHSRSPSPSASASAAPRGRLLGPRRPPCGNLRPRIDRRYTESPGHNRYQSIISIMFNNVIVMFNNNVQ